MLALLAGCYDEPPTASPPDAPAPDAPAPDGGCTELGTCDAAVPDAAVADAAPVAQTLPRPGRFSTLGVRAWQSGSLRVVDDELEASGSLCSGSGRARICVTGGFLQ